MSDTAVAEPLEETVVEPADEVQPEVEASTEATVETPAPAEPTFDPREVQAELEYLRETNAQLLNWARNQSQGGTPAPASEPEPPTFVDEYGNFDPAAFADYQRGRDEKLLKTFNDGLEAVTRPIYASQEAAVIAEGEQQMKDVIADDFARNGELPLMGDDVIERIVNDVRVRYFPEVAQRYGQTDKAAEVAIERAVQAERDYQTRIADAAEKRIANRNATLAGARSEPAPGGAGLVTSADEILPEGALAQRYAANANRIRYT